MKTQIPLTDLNEAVESPVVLGGSHVSGQSAKANDDLSAIDLLIVLAEGKRIIFAVTAGFAIFATLVSQIGRAHV